jgi:hypothetical protein
MKTDQTLARTVGQTFVELLRKELSNEDWREMLRRNASPEYRTSCASHDFTDANEVMAEACAAHDVDVDPTSDDGLAIWNAAWAVAKPQLTAGALDAVAHDIVSRALTVIELADGAEEHAELIGDLRTLLARSVA